MDVTIVVGAVIVAVVVVSVVVVEVVKDVLVEVYAVKFCVTIEVCWRYPEQNTDAEAATLVFRRSRRGLS